MTEELKIRLLAIVESIDRNVGTAHPQQQDGLTDGQWLVLSLLAVCRNNMRGIYFLLKEDHAEQARIVGRTLLVDCMRLLYLHSNPQHLDFLKIAFDIGSIHQERRLVEEFKKHTGDADSDEALALLNQQEVELRAEALELGHEEKELNRSVALLSNTQQLFESSPQPEGYFVFRHASHAAHTTRLTLDAHQKQQEDGTIQLLWGGSPGNVLRVGLQSATLFLSGYRAAAEMLGWETLDAIRSFSELASKQIAELQRDAGIGGLDSFMAGDEVKPVDENDGILDS